MWARQLLAACQLIFCLSAFLSVFLSFYRALRTDVNVSYSFSYNFFAFHCLMATTFAPCSWQSVSPPRRVDRLLFYLCHCSPCVRQLRDRWTCVTPDSLLNGELGVSLSKPRRRMHAERCTPPYQSMGISLSAAKAWRKGPVFNCYE